MWTIQFLAGLRLCTGAMCFGLARSLIWTLPFGPAADQKCSRATFLIDVALRDHQRPWPICEERINCARTPCGDVCLLPTAGLLVLFGLPRRVRYSVLESSFKTKRKTALEPFVVLTSARATTLAEVAKAACFGATGYILARHVMD